MPSRSHLWRAVLAAFALAVLLPMGASLAEETESSKTTDDVATRVARLEAEISALRIMVGALEAAVIARPSLAPDGVDATPAGDDDLKGRVRGLEVQIGALTRQMDTFLSKLNEMSEAAPADKTMPKPKVAAPDPKPERAKEKVAKDETAKKDAPAMITDPEPRPRAATAPKPNVPEPKVPETKIAEPKVADPKVPAPERKPPIVEAKRELKPEPEPQDEDVPIPPSLAPVVPPPAKIADPSKPRWYGPRPQPSDDQATPSSTITTGSLPDKASPAPQSLFPSKAAQALYEEGYGDYLRRDYAGAEAAFGKLVSTYPRDPLAGSAQYWVGESQYLRKQYQKAADSFLDGYRKYSGSDKASDTLLRLGMSLAELGKTEAACATFKKLGARFPNSAQRGQAKTAAGKAGCP